MRILLAQNALYYPAHGGGDRSNRLLMEALAARGHTCRVVARVIRFGPDAHAAYLRNLEARGVSSSAQEGVVRFERGGVDVRVVTQNPNLRVYFGSQIGDFQPDVILTSTDDPAQLLLDVALKAPARTVYLARAPLALPFGPDCAFPIAAKTDALRQADAVVGVSRYVADYILRWSGIPAVYVPISLPDPPPYADLGRFDNEFITMVNPCAVKGISIFLALADRMPEVRFLAVPTWGTTQADRVELAARPNVKILDPSDDVDDVLRRTRVLLVPSLWAEARSRVVMEAMLRGVPVIASDIGGIPEAKLGTDYLLPVRPIGKYQARMDEQMVPVPVVPDQDIGPWQAALERLVSDRQQYERLAAASRSAALAEAGRLSIEPFEDLLERVTQEPQATAHAREEPASALDRLSPDRRKLLALRLRKVSGRGALPDGALRLFCFPHAGGGPGAFHGWAEHLPETIVVSAMRSPQNKPTDMAGLARAYYDAIAPHLNEPFAFFGHSMGAIAAFELGRLLRSRKRPMPRLLVASGARAPQYRLGHVPPPEPSEEAFIDALRQLEGTPAEVLDSPELLRLILPALREDTAIYRNYVYHHEPPLDCPIQVYGGADDRNILPEHLEAWRIQTTGDFGMRIFPGGHFYLQTHRGQFLEALSRDCGV